MRKLLHLLLITVILYFLFFQDIKEQFDLSDFKDKISKEKKCNNTKDMEICITNNDCGVYTSSKDKKSKCVLDYYNKSKNKHTPYFSNILFKNNKSLPYYDLNKGIYSHDKLNYTTNNKHLFKPIKFSTFDIRNKPKASIPLSNKLIVDINKYSNNNKDISEIIVYDITNEINNKFYDYIVDGADKFEIIVNPISDKSKKLNISFKYSYKKPYLVKITGLPKKYLNETLFEIGFYAKRGAILECDGNSTSENCKYKDCSGGGLAGSAHGDPGYIDKYRGYYDARGCGTCNDYCRWVGGPGYLGGDPANGVTSGGSFWSCITPNNEYAKMPEPWTAKKCTKQGAKSGKCDETAVAGALGDRGYDDEYRGYYDASGCGICNDYCRWVGNSGSGGDPANSVTSGESFWSCITPTNNYAKMAGPWTAKKCTKQGAKSGG